MTYPYPFVAREGWPFVGMTLAAAALSSWLLGLGLVSALCWAALAVVLLFFRDPPRLIPAAPGAVLAPADGRVMAVEKARDPYTDRDALRISVVQSLFSLQANRASVDGVVRQVHYTPAQSPVRRAGDAPGGPERSAVVIDTHGSTVTLVQEAGRIARRILCQARPGHVLTRGQRYGRTRFGTRIDVYLPPGALPQVAAGDRVAATTTILATLPKA